MLAIASTCLDAPAKRQHSMVCFQAESNMRASLGGRGWKAMLQKLRSLSVAGDVHSHRYILSTGKTMANQYEPWYFGVAFAFCFKFCTGISDAPAFLVLRGTAARMTLQVPSSLPGSSS